ncbi:hypothetical protein OAN307_c12730 [Octadecabacter antarcticus 307]|uniref:Uncharacterized protein n=1 Tax=Octadecabacter antarcticus 307 TaxID=391626 RepID=M9R444_9RHOB|nr:hypothetical protein OAN307_c12730 [Octadecabacter antarcticus 307]
MRLLRRSQLKFQGRVIKAIPSFKAMWRVVQELDDSCDWVDWNARAMDDRRGVSGY